MDYSHAGLAAAGAVFDKVGQSWLCLGNGHAVQVDFCLHRIFAARELAQGAFADRLAVVTHGFATACLDVIDIGLKACTQRRRFVRTRKAGFGPRFFADGRNTRPGFNRFRAGYSAAKQIGVLVAHIKASQWLWKVTVVEYSERVPSRQRKSLATTSMKILVSNDDGYLATGINVLTDALVAVADVIVVAPDRNRSAASNSLTLSDPLRVKKHAENRYSVNGTPSDCVHLALTGLLDEEPDLVVSGINHGANLGDDVIYSGTVAAAMEGRFLGLPTIAVSLVGIDDRPTHFETAARVAADMVRKLSTASLSSDVILNVNVPDLPFEELAGIQAVRLGFRHKSEPVVKSKDPHGRTIFWVGPAGKGQDSGVGTDFHAIEKGFVTVTPLLVDLTRHDSLPQLKTWLDS